MRRWAIGQVRVLLDSSFLSAAPSSATRHTHPTPVKRRFNDFITLNKDIALRYPRAPLPSLPGRRWFGSLSPETVRLLVQSRRMRTSLLTRIRR